MDDLMRTAQIVRQSPAFLPGLFLLVGLFAVYWPLFERLPKLWLRDEGYYSHGFLVPLIAGYIVSRNWDLMKGTPVKPQVWAIVPLLGFLYLVRGAYRTDVMQFMSYGLIFTLLLGILFIAGWGWFRKLAWPTIYLAFMLPIFGMFIENYTNPLQMVSAKVAEMILRVLGLGMQIDGTLVYLDHFNFNVGAACSGLKLLFAVFAFTVFFVLIARLRFFGNAVMFVITIPLCLFINGLRIALIGLVGNQWGQEAGTTFHDWSGYITLLVCFFILFKIARLLGWKD